MDASEREEIKGFLLDAWIEDLRNDRSPRVLPEMRRLSQHEVDEVLRLARWYKASLYPSTPTASTVERQVSSLREMALRERSKEGQRAAQIAEDAADFASLLRAARESKGLRIDSLERWLALPSGMIHRLEAGLLPPHRVGVDKMIQLLRRLGLVSARAVTLVQQASLQWASTAFSGPQTQLGRLDPDLSSEARQQLLAAGNNEDVSELAQEIARIDEYCQALSQRLN